ncbi:MAG: hypothetical protein ACE5IO_09955 [Thermoplasmata archaeon]
MIKTFDMRAVHSVTIELHGGMLTLAFACIAIKVVDILWGRFLGDKGGILRRILRKASEYSTPTILLAAIGGVIGLLLSAYTGSSLMPFETISNSSIALNKIMVTVFAVELWSILVVFNLIYKEKAWETRGRTLMMVLTGGLGYFFSITGGSIGGTMAGKVSIMEPLWEFLGVDLHSSWILSSDIVLVLVVAVTVGGILLVVFSTRILEFVSPKSKASNK